MPPLADTENDDPPVTAPKAPPEAPPAPPRGGEDSGDPSDIWIGMPIVAKGRTKKRHYSAVKVRRGAKEFVVRVGDAVEIRSFFKKGARPYLGLVEALWEDQRKVQRLRTAWCYHQDDCDKVDATLVPELREARPVHPQEVFLSEMCDDNKLELVLRKATLVVGEAVASDRLLKAHHYLVRRSFHPEARPPRFDALPPSLPRTSYGQAALKRVSSFPHGRPAAVGAAAVAEAAAKAGPGATEGEAGAGAAEAEAAAAVKKATAAETVAATVEEVDAMAAEGRAAATTDDLAAALTARPTAAAGKATTTGAAAAAEETWRAPSPSPPPPSQPSDGGKKRSAEDMARENAPNPDAEKEKEPRPVFHAAGGGRDNGSEESSAEGRVTPIPADAGSTPFSLPPSLSPSQPSKRPRIGTKEDGPVWSPLGIMTSVNGGGDGRRRTKQTKDYGVMPMEVDTAAAASAAEAAAAEVTAAGSAVIEAVATEAAEAEAAAAMAGAARQHEGEGGEAKEMAVDDEPLPAEAELLGGGDGNVLSRQLSEGTVPAGRPAPRVGNAYQVDVQPMSAGPAAARAGAAAGSCDGSSSGERAGEAAVWSRGRLSDAAARRYVAAAKASERLAPDTPVWVTIRRGGVGGSRSTMRRWGIVEEELIAELGADSDDDDSETDDDDVDADGDAAIAEAGSLSPPAGCGSCSGASNEGGSSTGGYGGGSSAIALAASARRSDRRRRRRVVVRLPDPLYDATRNTTIMRITVPRSAVEGRLTEDRALELLQRCDGDAAAAVAAVAADPELALPAADRWTPMQIRQAFAALDEMRDRSLHPHNGGGDGGDGSSSAGGGNGGGTHVAGKSTQQLLAFLNEFEPICGPACEGETVGWGGQTRRSLGWRRRGASANRLTRQEREEQARTLSFLRLHSEAVSPPPSPVPPPHLRTPSLPQAVQATQQGPPAMAATAAGSRDGGGAAYGAAAAAATLAASSSAGGKGGVELAGKISPIQTFLRSLKEDLPGELLRQAVQGLAAYSRGALDAAGLVRHMCCCLAGRPSHIDAFSRFLTENHRRLLAACLREEQHGAAQLGPAVGTAAAAAAAGRL